jgi:hypothetical protein
MADKISMLVDFFRSPGNAVHCVMENPTIDARNSVW